MSIGWQIVLFAVPGFLIYLGIFFAVPKLVKHGCSLLYAFWLCLWTPALLLLPVSLWLFRSFEGGSLTWTAISERFRLVPLTAADWAWIGAAVVVTVLTEQLLEPVSKVLAGKRPLAPPDYLPAPFNPLRRFSLPPREFFGVPLRGNWMLLVVFIPVHILAMFSEEMLWRGYLLPIQEAQFGVWAWVVNGLMWAWLMHMVLRWHFVAMVPGMLIAPLAAQFIGSTWASFAVHTISNAPLWIILLMGITANPREDSSAA